MKKSIMMIACTFTLFLHGMEHLKKGHSNTLNFLVDHTTVRLIKCPIYELDKVDLMVVGRVQQQTFKKPNSFHDIHEIGLMEIVDNNMVYIKNKDIKDFDSHSNYDTYKPYDDFKLGEAKLWEHAHQEAIKSEVISILEPRLSIRRYFDTKQGQFVTGYHYYAHRECLDKGNHFVNVEADGDEALAEALKDLSFCYKKALIEGWKKIGKKEHKSIAFSLLGTDVGVPRDKAAEVTVATILEFIKNSPEKFSFIYVLVKKWPDFARYKELLKAFLEKNCC